MFTETAHYYDKLYAFKDYQQEAAHLIEIIGRYPSLPGRTLLDVACGTGAHIRHLRQSFDVAGLDLSAELLEVARARNPGVPFHEGDMVSFALGRKFAVITNLFSSIGYVRTLENLQRAVLAMRNHLAPGGLLVFEPWFTPEAWRADTVHALLVDEPALKIARVSTSFATGRLSYFDMHYLIGTPRGTTHHVEHHELGLFTHAEMQAALAGAGLEATYDEQGLTGRGLYVGREPPGRVAMEMHDGR